MMDTIPTMYEKTDVLIIGAGAAGLMCAIEAGKRQRNVIVLDQANKPGKKILMSGGGRCNFTNYHIHPDCYISHNPHFCKSALSRYTQWDFIDLVKQYKIPFHEKTLGQLFCDNKSKDILEMLLLECEQAGVDRRDRCGSPCRGRDRSRHSDRDRRRRRRRALLPSGRRACPGSGSRQDPPAIARARRPALPSGPDA